MTTRSEAIAVRLAAAEFRARIYDLEQQLRTMRLALDALERRQQAIRDEWAKKKRR